MYSFNKKGLFLAEILLAVVIAAVIMGAGYLLFNDIRIENKKIQSRANLESMVTIFSSTYGEVKVIDPPEDASNETSSFVKAGIFPSSMDTRDDNVYSVFSGKLLVSPVGKTPVLPQGTSIFFITYQGLKDLECKSFLRSIVKTKPIAFFDGEFKAGSTDLICMNDIYNGKPFTYSSRLLLSRNKMCQQGQAKTRDLTVLYSRFNEDYLTCNH